ncbi:hypothetical protein ACOWKQ_06220, partial [Helicobacter pylori]
MTLLHTNSLISYCFLSITAILIFVKLSKTKDNLSSFLYCSFFKVAKPPNQSKILLVSIHLLLRNIIPSLLRSSQGVSYEKANLDRCFIISFGSEFCI